MRRLLSRAVFTGFSDSTKHPRHISITVLLIFGYRQKLSALCNGRRKTGWKFPGHPLTLT